MTRSILSPGWEHGRTPMIAVPRRKFETPCPARRGLDRAILTLLIWMFAASAGAQTANTVRDNEFRSRWADYQVDRPQEARTADQGADTDEQAGLLSAFRRSFVDVLRNGPLQTRANLAAGWEYSDEATLLNNRSNTSDNSAFVSPGIGFFYNNQLGPATVSARYSAGYVYYLDQSYVAANNGGGIFSQTAGLDVQVDGLRSAFTSGTGFSYGNGNDIESGTQRTQLTLTETAAASYVLSTFTRLGTTGGISYTSYDGGGVADTDTFTDTASVYIEYAYSPKTRARVEVAAGQQLQNADGAAAVNGSNTADRWYYQALFSGDYFPSAKLSLSVGAGYGFQNDSSVLGRGRSGSHPIYRITLQYVPTLKTTALLRFGYEGVDVAPSLEAQVNWQFRLTTSANLSVYQTNNFSTYEVDQNLLTRGALVSVQQRLFGRVDLALSVGVEQSSGYGNLVPGQQPTNQDPYFFASVSLLWEINSYLAFQSYYRGYTGEAGAVINQNGLQSRASASLRLTF